MDLTLIQTTIDLQIDKSQISGKDISMLNKAWRCLECLDKFREFEHQSQSHGGCRRISYR
jgi:hypothetical protein